MQDDDDPVVHGQLPKPPLELVTIKYRAEGIARDRFMRGRQGRVGEPLGRPLRLGVTGVNEDPVGPALELGRVTQPADVAPDVQVRLLGGVLGPGAVPQDAVRGPEEPRVVGGRQCVERSQVPCLHPEDELVVHAHPVTVVGSNIH